MTSRFNHAASDSSSRSVIVFTRSLISGETLAFKISVQLMGPNVTQQQAASYPAFQAKCSSNPNYVPPHCGDTFPGSMAFVVRHLLLRRWSPASLGGLSDHGI